VQGFSEDSGAAAAGLKESDRIVKIGEERIDSYADVRIALIGSRPGQKMPVEVERARLIGDPERLSFEVELH
jgi:membrane-associated protease RseP (regulator of RpoE activity)